MAAAVPQRITSPAVALVVRQAVCAAGGAGGGSGRARVAHQHSSEPAVTQATPCTKPMPGCSDSHTLLHSTDSTGAK